MSHATAVSLTDVRQQQQQQQLHGNGAAATAGLLIRFVEDEDAAVPGLERFPEKFTEKQLVAGVTAPQISGIATIVYKRCTNMAGDDVRFACRPNANGSGVIFSVCGFTCNLNASKMCSDLSEKGDRIAAFLANFDDKTVVIEYLSLESRGAASSRALATLPGGAAAGSVVKVVAAAAPGAKRVRANTFDAEFARMTNIGVLTRTPYDVMCAVMVLILNMRRSFVTNMFQHRYSIDVSLSSDNKVSVRLSNFASLVDLRALDSVLIRWKTTPRKNHTTVDVRCLVDPENSTLTLRIGYTSSGGIVQLKSGTNPADYIKRELKNAMGVDDESDSDESSGDDDSDGDSDGEDSGRVAKKLRS